MTEPSEPSSAGAPEAAPPPASGAASAVFGLPAPMPFQVLLDEAMRWTRRRFRAIYPPIAVPVAVLTAGVAALQAVWQGPAAMSGIDPWQSLARGCSFVLLSLPVGLLMGLLYAAMMVAALDAVSGRGVDIRRALRFVVRPGVLGAQLLVLLSLLAAVLCCLLPALYVGPLLSLTLPAMAAEGMTGPAALRRSAELTRHNPQRRWLTSPIVKILALGVAIMVISYLVTLVPALPVLILQWLSIMRKAAAGEDIQQSISGYLWIQVPLRCLSSFATTAVYLYSSFAMVLLFFDLRARREGLDLQRAIAGMAGAGPQPPPSAPLPPLATPPLAPGSPGFPVAQPAPPRRPNGAPGGGGGLPQ